MHCPFCNTVNDDEKSFCVSCGKTISQNDKTEANVMPPTQNYTTNQYSNADTDSCRNRISSKTAVLNQPPPNQSHQDFTSDIPNIGANLTATKAAEDFCMFW